MDSDIHLASIGNGTVRSVDPRVENLQARGDTLMTWGHSSCLDGYAGHPGPGSLLCGKPLAVALADILANRLQTSPTERNPGRNTGLAPWW